MAETNSTASGGFSWSNLGGLLTQKAVDLADSYAALKLGKEAAKATAAGTPASPVTSTPSTAPAAPSAPNMQKLLLWIGGGLVAVVVVIALLRPRSRR